MNARNQPCSVPDCTSRAKARLMCALHYVRFKNHGDPLVTKIAADGMGSLDGGYRRMEKGGISKYEHVLIAEKALGKPLPPGAKVHHVNGDRLDNRNINLVICPSTAYHNNLHCRARAFAASGHADYRRCQYCKAWDDPKNMHESLGKVLRHWHKACVNEYNRKLAARRRGSNRDGY